MQASEAAYRMLVNLSQSPANPTVADVLTGSGLLEVILFFFAESLNVLTRTLLPTQALINKKVEKSAVAEDPRIALGFELDDFNINDPFILPAPEA